MELEKSPAFNPESNDGYRQWSSMNGKSLLKDYWRTLKSWHDFSSLESFQTGHLVITCLTQKAYTESHVKCSRMKLVVANASGAHIPALCPPLSSAAGLGNGSSSLCASTSFHGNLQPRGKGSQWWAWEVLLNSPEVPAEQSSAVYSCHLGNTTLNGLVLPGPLSLLLCPVFWSHFPNKLLALALRSFFASHAFRRALAIETYIELSVYRKYRRQRNKITVDSRDIQFSQDGWLVFQANRTPENKG